VSETGVFVSGQLDPSPGAPWDTAALFLPPNVPPQGQACYFE
jgi:hypothetical protein